MSASEILLLAAEKIMDDDFYEGCCGAVGAAMDELDLRFSDARCLIEDALGYLALFRPDKGNVYWYGWTRQVVIGCIDAEVIDIVARNTAERTTALCFAAAIAKSEGN